MTSLVYRIKAFFSGAEKPEHTEEDMRKVLKHVQDEIDFSPEEWVEVFETLKNEAEMREAPWLQ